MTSWFSQTVSIDEQVERATSESLPTGEQDLALNLDICDMIRSKTVNPKDAMRSLKRRLLNKNPNVQIATLHLIDICIKNGGTHFLNEIASREFMDSAMLALKPQNGTVNYDVKQLMLEYIQNWAIAFDNQIQLSYVNKIYNQLKQEGYEFPSPTGRQQISSSFIDSSAPPEWVDSDTCMKSGTPFTFVNRKHHCRNCGGVFVQKHCQSYIPLPHYGINTPVRVCDDCNDKLKSKNKPQHQPSRSSSSSVKYTNNPFHQQQQQQQNNDDENDDELQRALKLSLEEANRQPAGPPMPAQQPQPQSQPQDEEEDEDMKAAIAASLRDMQQGNNTQPQTQQEQHTEAQQPPQTSMAPEQSPAPTGTPTAQPDEFTPLEEEILYRYIHLVESIQRAPPGAILKETKLQQLNDNVAALRPKLARTLGQTIDKYDRLVDMHGKLATVVRFYDQILEQRLSDTYNRHSISDYNQPQQLQQPMGTGGSWNGSSYYQQPYAPPPPPVNSATHPQTYQPSAPPMTTDQTEFEARYPPLPESQPQQPQAQSQPQQTTKAPKEEPVLIEL
jgi:growth factor-regulated tyrosine kinase substrate